MGRYSSCCTETRRGHTRSLALVGKLFPTTDPNHSEPLRTASFITQQDLAGDNTDYINDVELRNAPDTHAWRRGSGMPIFLLRAPSFSRSIKNPRFASCTRSPSSASQRSNPRERRNSCACWSRQINLGSKVKSWISATKSWRRFFDRGDPTPKRTLTLCIEVTDEGSTRGTAAFQRRTFKNWRHIGKLTFDNAVASYNGDFVVHFNHPTWRANRNDPSTATRISGRKVR